MRYFYYWLKDLALTVLTFNLFITKGIIRQSLRNEKFNSVLDLGCGTGSYSSLFNPKVYIGVDLDEAVVKYARKCHPKYKFKAIDARELNLDKKFDLILIVGVLHHLNDADTERVLKGMASCLNHPGKIIIIEAIPPLKKWNLLGFILRKWDNWDKGNFIRTTSEYKNLVEKKFKILNCEPRVGETFDYAVIIARHKTA